MHTGDVDECCTPSAGDSERYDPVFNEEFAERIARRYTRKGLTAVERMIVDLLVDEVGIEGATILEVGGGVGEIQLELLRHGASRTMNLELSHAYEPAAARLAAAAGVTARVTRTVGVDLAIQSDAIQPADVVVMHRVVCCYPDVERLLGAAADHAIRAIVFTYPPRNAVTRATNATLNFIMRLRRRSYRGFVHSPGQMIEILRRHGMNPRYRHRHRSWHLIDGIRP